MKFKSSTKIIAIIALTSSMLALTGCSTVVDKLVDKSNTSQEKTLEQVDKEIVKEAEELNGGFEDKSSPGTSKSTNPLLTGYKAVGDSSFGYFQIPEEFVTFTDVDTASPDVMQYSDRTGSFILTARSIPTTAAHADVVASMVSHMQSSGPSVLVTEGTVGGNKASELFQYYKDEDYTLHAWIVEEQNARKYIAIEYKGKQEELKNSIIDHYSATEKPQKEGSSSTEKSGTSSSTKKSENSSSDELYVDESGKVDILEQDDYHLHVKIFGDFEPGNSYFLSLLDRKDFINEYSDDFIAQKSSQGAFLDVDMHTKNKLEAKTYRFDIVNSIDSEESQRYLMSKEFTLK